MKRRIPSDFKNDTPRSNHDWSVPVYGTIHPGLAYPVKWRRMNVGDRYRGKPSTLIQSMPIQGPLLNGFKYTVIGTFMPDSVLYGWMRNGQRIKPKEYQMFDRYYFDPLGDVQRVSGVYPRLKPGLEQSKNLADWRIDHYDKEVKNQFNHIGRGGLWDWLGVPPGAVCPLYSTVQTAATLQTGDAWHWPLEAAFCYFLSCYYYFANMQEDEMYFTRDAYTLSSSNTYAGQHLTFQQLMQSFDPNTVLQAVANLQFHSTARGSYDSELFDVLSDKTQREFFAAWLSSGMGAHGGLFPVPYSPDLFGNIIKAGESPTAYVATDEESDEKGNNAFGIPKLRLQSKIQNMFDRLFVSGGRLGDVFRTLFGVKSSPYTNKPEFLGIWQSSIDPSNVVAQAAGEISSGAEPITSEVGQMSSRIDRYSNFGKSAGIDYYADEPGVLMFIAALVPDPAYSQGLNPDLMGISFADVFNPELNGIGFQSVPRSRFTMMPGKLGEVGWYRSGSATPSSGEIAVTDPNADTIGEEVAWSWLRTDYPLLHGEFAQNGMYQYWTLARRFTEVGDDEQLGVGSLILESYYGSYVNPMSWQYLFAGTSLLDPNFVLLSNFGATVTSSVSSKYMPYLGR